MFPHIEKMQYRKLPIGKAMNFEAHIASALLESGAIYRHNVCSKMNYALSAGSKRKGLIFGLTKLKYDASRIFKNDLLLLFFLIAIK